MGRCGLVFVAGYRKAAIEVLSEAGKALRIDEITKRAIDLGYIKPKGKTPISTMGAIIYRDIKRFGENSKFEKADSFTFKLRDLLPPKPPIPGDGRGLDLEQTDDVEHGGFEEPNKSMYTQKMGKAGEYRVMSELLLRGYSANFVEPDDGVDISGRNSRSQFEIQVKTATRKNDNYIMTIKKRPFESKYGPQMYYVFVLRDPDNRLDFVTLSSKDIRKRLRNGDMTENKAGYQARFSKKGDKVFLGAHDVTQYRNDWDF